MVDLGVVYQLTAHLNAIWLLLNFTGAVLFVTLVVIALVLLFIDNVKTGKGITSLFTAAMYSENKPSTRKKIILSVQKKKIIAELKLAILMRKVHLWENRGSELCGGREIKCHYKYPRKQAFQEIFTQTFGLSFFIPHRARNMIQILCLSLHSPYSTHSILSTLGPFLLPAALFFL